MTLAQVSEWKRTEKRAMAKSLAMLKKQLEATKAKESHLAAQVAEMERAQDKSRKEGDRKADTARKILAGALVLKKSETNEKFHEWLMNELNGSLVRARDRALFGLALLNPPDNPSSAEENHRSNQPPNQPSN